MLASVVVESRQSHQKGDWRRTPGIGEYAQPERERRFLVRYQPDPAQAGRLIEDSYILGTTLRLRRVTVGTETTLKLTQKVRVHPDSPAEVALTNMYLTEPEYGLLAQLPARQVHKTRRACVAEGTRFAVDEFHGPLTGLVMAEVEVGSLDAALPRPDWLGAEVTHDDRFSGGSLAALNGPEAIALLLRGE